MIGPDGAGTFVSGARPAGWERHRGAGDATLEVNDMLHIQFDTARIREFCQRNHIRRLSFFGSVLRDDFGPDSDVDVLVEFEPGKTPGLAFFRMERELSDLLGRQVDLNTAGFLSKYFRDEVLREAEPVDVAA